VQSNAESLPLYLKPRLLSIMAVVSALTVVGLLLVSRWAQMDLDRDLKTWQDKLGLTADSRAAAVSEWVDDNFTEMKKLAANPSLQIYFAEMQDASHENAKRETPAQKAEALQRGEPEERTEPAQKAYLRNLLIFTADRMGFVPQSLPTTLQLHTDIPFEAHSGIVVLDMNNNIVVSTPYLGSMEPQLLERLAKLPPEKPALIDMYRGDKGVVNIGFTVPVYGIQADPAASRPVARIVGLKPVGEGLFKLLRHPGSTEKTLTALLVRKEGDNIVYLSPLSETGGALEKTLTAKPDKLAEAFAAANPGAFSQGRDYQGNAVLFTSRAIPNTPWTLIMKIDTSEALADSQVRRSGMMAIFILIIGVVVITMFAVWYSASSRRALMATRYFKNMAAVARAQERLLRLVSDSQRQGIYILDKEGRYHFANHSAAANAHMQPDDMPGKTASDVLGAAKAQEITDTAEAALYNQHTQSRIRRLNEGGEEVIIRAEYIPLEHIPLPDLPENTPGVLVVEQDISEVVHERERRLRLHGEIIDTLIAIVDKRDPHAANHSALVSQIAFEVAESMGLDAPMCETVRTAGSLMNIGKIIIPAQLLTKREDLSEEERRMLKDSLASSAALLKGISFEGPVVETLEQVQERWDGTGPQGLKEEGILISARIIAAVNAFVGMVSSRSYRAPMPIDTALKTLLGEVDTLYDRKAVVSLANYIDNQGGRAALEQVKAA